MFILNGALVLIEARAIKAIAHCLILQVAFTALITDRAIERMVDQQKFHDAFTRLFHPVSIGTDDHTVASRHRAGRNRLWRPLHINKAHPAITRNRQPVVIAETWNFNICRLAGMQNGGAVLDLNLNVVHCQLWHLFLGSLFSSIDGVS